MGYLGTFPAYNGAIRNTKESMGLSTTTSYSGFINRVKFDYD